jgi:hypothetical protein
VSIPQDLDVDGHTNLDNLSVAGVSTFADRVTISGGKDLFMFDNGVVRLGNNSNVADFQMFHNGTHTYLNNATGTLYIQNTSTDGAVAISAKTGQNGIVVKEAPVRLYYDNTLRFSTSGVGATVYGNLDVTGDLDVDGHTNLDNVSISGVTTMTGMLRVDGGNFQLYGTAPNIFLRDTNDNPDYRFMNSHGSIKIFDETNGLDRFIINPSGKVSVLYDLDVDGHTELDNVSIAGVTTVTGDVNVGTSQASGVILTSPNGTRYRLVVANDGTLSTTAA